MRVVVWIAGFAVIAACREPTPTPLATFEHRGLRFDHVKGWNVSAGTPLPPPRFVRDPMGSPPRPAAGDHVVLTSPDDRAAMIEISIEPKPEFSNLAIGLELERRTRWGELYTLDDSSVRQIAERDWLRTSYRYSDVGVAIEYATLDREHRYVVTMFGPDATLKQTESIVGSSLRGATPQVLPLVVENAGARAVSKPVSRAFDSAALIVVADFVDGQLRVRDMGTGAIVGRDGSVLTNYHLVHDKGGRLHDAFVIGRYHSRARGAELLCVGSPERGKLQRELDLALLKCDLDFDGRAAELVVWPTLPEARAADISNGQRLWMLGYSDFGGARLVPSQGVLQGVGEDYLVTDLAVTRASSGGPVVDYRGTLVGIASGMHVEISGGGDVTEIMHVGRVRPLAAAGDLLAIAAIGWTPRDGFKDAAIQPTLLEGPARGVRILTQIEDASSGAPIADALVMVVRSGVQLGAIDVNQLDDQVIAWGRSNTQGEVLLRQRVPIGKYSVIVTAPGYEPLLGDDQLQLDDKTPEVFDPWGEIVLQAR